MEYKQVRQLKIILLVSSLASLVLMMLAAFEENLAGEWRQIQANYRETLVAQAKSDTTRASAEAMEIEFRQLFLSELGRVDRCMTCHLGVEHPGMSNAKQPLKAHPGKWLRQHPVDKFGCTVCHDGQGRATKIADAHGDVPHWETPLLRGDQIYTSCGRCHYENDLYGSQNDLYAREAPPEPLDQSELDWTVPGAEVVGKGKKLTLESGCLGCHEYRGRGGSLGPEITAVGDKVAHDFDFKNVKGERTVAQWLYEHFKEPAAVTPETVMPDLELNDEQARDLATYMLSLHRKSQPAAFTPVPPARTGKSVDGGRLFRMFCSACHGKDGVGNTVRDPEIEPTLVDAPRELMTPSLNHPDTLAVASDDYLRRIIATGRSGTSMGGWNLEQGGLDAKEIDRIIDYIRSWQKEVPALDRISSAYGDARKGRVIYRGQCAACHGNRGQGGIGVALRSPSFLAVASDEFLRDSIVFGRANTAMPSWKDLGDQQVSDLLAYIRSWQLENSRKQEVLTKLANGPLPRREIRIGKGLFRSHCSSCHGRKAEGGIGPALRTNSLLAVVEDDYLYDAIVSGRPGTAMPSWKSLRGEDVAAIIGYMRSLNDNRRQKLEDFVARGDWVRGARLYRGSCSGCHGDNAQGGTGPQLNNPVFLASVSNAVLRHWVSYGRDGTEMRPFLKGLQGIVELTAEEIEDIVTYLRQIEGRPRLEGSRPGTGIAALGKRVYEGACSSCHGTEGQGATGSALANRDFLRVAADGYLIATIVLGRDGTEMRAMGLGGQGNVQLSMEDIDNVVAYLRDWARRPPTSLPHRYVAGADLGNGQLLYGTQCSGCHGPMGREGWAPALNNSEFLAAATDGFLQATIVRGRLGTAMRPFGRGGGGVSELEGKEINDIVAFIRTWAPEAFRPSEQPTPEQGDLVSLTTGR